MITKKQRDKMLENLRKMNETFLDWLFGKHRVIPDLIGNTNPHIKSKEQFKYSRWK